MQVFRRGGGRRSVLLKKAHSVGVRRAHDGGVHLFIVGLGPKGQLTHVELEFPTFDEWDALRGPVERLRAREDKK